MKGLIQLHNLKKKLDLRGIKYAEFREPDLNNEVTAIATDVESELFEKLNLI